jgi:dTDP-4-dehydrorhamnose reductase
MRIAITGTTGRVGKALVHHLAGRHEVIALPRTCLDLALPGCENILRELDFDVLLNPAGLTSLEQCEDEPLLARRVNAEAPEALAAVCRERRLKMLHFSTDYVFDGREPGLRTEDELPSPLSIYGKTKRDGEQAVLAAGAAVMRISWVFGPEKPAFPDQILDRALAGHELAAVADKFSRPTFTGDLCEWVEAWLEAGTPAGCFHASNGGPVTSWYGMALEILAYLADRGIATPPLKALALDEMTAFRAPRPRHTAMDTGRLEALLGNTPRDWREALREHLESRLISR